MIRQTLWIIAAWLAGCSAVYETPHPASPPSSEPQEIQRNQTSGLVNIGRVTVLERGSPQDAERAIKMKAANAKATYYQILFIMETPHSGLWYAGALLFQPLASERKCPPHCRA